MYVKQPIVKIYYVNIKKTKSTYGLHIRRCVPLTPPLVKSVGLCQWFIHVRHHVGNVPRGVYILQVVNWLSARQHPELFHSRKHRFACVPVCRLFARINHLGVSEELGVLRFTCKTCRQESAHEVFIPLGCVPESAVDQTSVFRREDVKPVPVQTDQFLFSTPTTVQSCRQQHQSDAGTPCEALSRLFPSLVTEGAAGLGRVLSRHFNVDTRPIRLV